MPSKNQKKKKTENSLDYITNFYCACTKSKIEFDTNYYILIFVAGLKIGCFSKNKNKTDSGDLDLPVPFHEIKPQPLTNNFFKQIVRFLSLLVFAHYERRFMRNGTYTLKILF